MSEAVLVKVTVEDNNEVVLSPDNHPPSHVQIFDHSVRLGVPDSPALEPIDYIVRFIIDDTHFFKFPFIAWFDPPGTPVPSEIMIGLAAHLEPAVKLREFQFPVTITPVPGGESKDFKFFLFIETDDATGDPAEGKREILVADPTIVTDPDPDFHSKEIRGSVGPRRRR